MSCFGMLLLDDVMHRFMAAQYPTLRVLSFVDNWDFMTWDPDAACKQLDALLAFTKLADLTVDRKKTFAWSTDPEVRRQLRSTGLPVLQHTKDLGAHIAFTRQRTNKSITGRLEDLTDFWDQLKRSRAGYKAKLRAVRTVAWPRGLFAVESAPVSRSTWLAQRRRATHALQMDKAGVNPLLLLGLVESYADPEFVAVVRTVAETRLQCPLDFWASQVFPAASGNLQCPASSPVSVLLDRFQPLGFVVHPSGCWEDRIGIFHPGTINFTELCHRLQWQWNSKVAADVAHRKDYGGLDFADPTRTRAKLASLPIDDQMLLRLSLAGALFTQPEVVNGAGPKIRCNIGTLSACIRKTCGFNMHRSSLPCVPSCQMPWFCALGLSCRPLTLRGSVCWILFLLFVLRWVLRFVPVAGLRFSLMALVCGSRTPVSVWRLGEPSLPVRVILLGICPLTG